VAKGLKLSKEEREIFNNLKQFMKNKIEWLGPKKDRELDPMLKDLVKDSGHYAVFSINEEDEYDKDRNLTHIADANLNSNKFDSLIIASSSDEALDIMKWNPFTHAMIINIKWMDFVYEARKPNSPHFFRMA
jgi:hypothetical protein